MIRFIYFDVGGIVVKDFSGTNQYSEWKRSIGIEEAQDAEFDNFFDFPYVLFHICFCKMSAHE